ncbi:hypothetical protein NUSPORA_00038 [Nucleospora cyclopteri]
MEYNDNKKLNCNIFQTKEDDKDSQVTTNDTLSNFYNYINGQKYQTSSNSFNLEELFSLEKPFSFNIQPESVNFDNSSFLKCEKVGKPDFNINFSEVSELQNLKKANIYNQNTLYNLLGVETADSSQVNNTGHEVDMKNFYQSNSPKAQLNQNFFYNFGEEEQTFTLKQKDRLLPLANVSKIMKRSVPLSAKIAKEAKDLVQQSATEFIAIVTCKAKELAQKEMKKVVSGEDLIKAMEELDLHYFSEITNRYFNQYKKTTKHHAFIYNNPQNNL